MPIPFRYVAGVFARQTNPREFFEAVYPQIVAEGRQAEMAPFIRWMCAACTARFDMTAGQLISAVAVVAFAVPPGNSVLRAHRQRLLRIKLPDLGAAAPTGDVGLAHVGGLLVAELRQSRDEARERHDTAVTPGRYYGALLTKHMRLSQVATEGELAPVHQELARVNKKREVRNTYQVYFNTLVLDAGRAHLQGGKLLSY